MPSLSDVIALLQVVVCMAVSNYHCIMLIFSVITVLTDCNDDTVNIVLSDLTSSFFTDAGIHVQSVRSSVLVGLV